MGKILLQEALPLQVSWMRYGSALLFAFLCLGLVRIFRRRELSSVGEVFHSAALPWVFSLGMITFFGSAVTQYLGLSQSTSTANALLVALEPLFAVFLAWIFLHEAVRKRQASAFALALIGFFLLSNVKPHDLGGSLHLFSFGNLLLLLTMPMEAMYTIISRKIGGRIKPLSLFAAALTFGFMTLTLYVAASSAGFPKLDGLSLSALLALLWIGPLGTTLTYVFWSLALVRAPVAAVCLTLFVQPILGTLFSAFYLGERLDFWQMMGGLMILGALTLQTTVALKPAKRSPL